MNLRISSIVMTALVALALTQAQPAHAREHGGFAVGALLGAAVGVTAGVALAPRAYAAPVYGAPAYAQPVYGPVMLPPVMVDSLPMLPPYVGPTGVIVGRTFDGHMITALPAQELPPSPFTAGRAVVPVVVFGPGRFAPVVLRPRAPVYPGYAPSAYPGQQRLAPPSYQGQGYMQNTYQGVRPLPAPAYQDPGGYPAQAQGGYRPY